MFSYNHFAKHSAVFFISMLQSQFHIQVSLEEHLSHFQFSPPSRLEISRQKPFSFIVIFFLRLLLVKERILVLLNMHDKHLSTKDLSSQPSIHSIITGITYWNDGRWVKHYIHIIWLNRHLSRNSVVSGIIIGLFTGSREQWLAIWYENCIITQF